MEIGQGVWLVSYCHHHWSLILTYPACNMSLPPAVSRTCLCLASLITALHSCLEHVPHSQCSVNNSWCVDEGAPTPVGSTFNYSSSMTSRWHLLPFPDIPMEPWSHGHIYVWLILDPQPQWQGCFLRHWGKKGNVRMWRKSGRVCKKSWVQNNFSYRIWYFRDSGQLQVIRLHWAISRAVMQKSSGAFTKVKQKHGSLALPKQFSLSSDPLLWKSF